MLLARIKSNWRTTLAGVASSVSGLALIVGSFATNKLSSEVIAASIGLISTGIGLIFGKDL